MKDLRGRQAGTAGAGRRRGVRTLAILFIFVMGALNMVSCRRTQIEPLSSAGGIPAAESSGTSELIAEVSSEEEAADIAAMYGIEFVEMFGPYALFRTDRDPAEVMREGQKKGYPPLDINEPTQLVE